MYSRSRASSKMIVLTLEKCSLQLFWIVILYWMVVFFGIFSFGHLYSSWTLMALSLQWLSKSLNPGHHNVKILTWEPLMKQYYYIYLFHRFLCNLKHGSTIWCMQQVAKLLTCWVLDIFLVFIAQRMLNSSPWIMQELCTQMYVVTRSGRCNRDTSIRFRRILHGPFKQPKALSTSILVLDWM